MRTVRLAPLVVIVAFMLRGTPVPAEQLPLVPVSPGLHGTVFTTFQANTPLKRPRGDKQRRHPFYQYVDLSAVHPEYGLSINTYLRGRVVANGDDASLDVYNAHLDYHSPDAKLDVRIGRQILTEGLNFTLLDGVLTRVRPVEGLELITYAGHQEVDLQPEPEQPDRNFTLYGAKLRASRWLGALLSLGYEGLSPDGFATRHFLTGSFDRVVPYTDFADVYSRIELDVAEASPSYVTAGIGMSVARPLYVNLEYDTYEPDEDRDEFLQDLIFDVFSVSRLHEARVGATYLATTYLTVATSYSFATYDVIDDESARGHIWKLGFTWDFWRQIGLQLFNGVYLIEGRGRDRTISANCGLSQELRRGLALDVAFAFANFESISGKEGNAYSYITGLQYLVARDLAVRAEVELNTNPDFRRDVRGNLGVSYFFSRS